MNTNRTDGEVWMSITPYVQTEHIEVCTIEDALVLTRGNKTGLAKMLKRNRGSINRYLKDSPGMLVRILRDEKTYITGIELINSQKESGDCVRGNHGKD